MSARRPLAAALALGVLLGGCGGEEVAMPDTSKTVPVMPERYQRRDLDAWMALDPQLATAEERAAQAFALAALEKQPIRAAPVLLRLLQDEDEAVRLAAVIAAGRLAPPSKRLAVVLTEFLASDDEPLRRHAREAVGELGAAAVEALGAALGHESLRVRWGALRALARVGAPAEALAPRVAVLAAESEHATEQRQARFTLARLGAAGVKACMPFLGSDSASERDEAAAALAYSGATGARVLAGGLAAENEVAAANAAGVIHDIAGRGALGDQAAAVSSALVAALKRVGPVRNNARLALLGLGAAARPALEAASRGEDEELAAIAKEVLEALPVGSSESE